MSNTPARLASEDVIINAPLSYAGSAQRIFRLRRLGKAPAATAAITVLAVVLVAAAWVLVTGWYLTWGLLLVPYRLLRRGARKRKAEALRHREMLGAINSQQPSQASETTPTPALEAASAAPLLPEANTSPIVAEVIAQPATEPESA